MVKKYGYDFGEAFGDLLFKRNEIVSNMTKQEKNVFAITISLLWLNGISMIILFFLGFKTVALIQLVFQIILSWITQGIRRKVKNRLR